MSRCPERRDGRHETFYTLAGGKMCVNCGERVTEPLEGDRDGVTYRPDRDFDRLNAQHLRVYQAMKDGTWRTLDEIATITEDPPASISARLRDFRKARFGSHQVFRKHVGDGLWKYRLVWNPEIRRPS